MSRFFLLVFLSALSKALILHSQNYDCNWIIGFGGNNIGKDPSSGLMQLNFKNGLDIYYPLDDNPICNPGFDPSSISNFAGELLFYTDGFNIYNKKQKVLKGGDHINPGEYWVSFSGGFYPIQNGTLFLPRPGSTSQYYLIHKGLKLFQNPLRTGCNYLYYSLIDTIGDNGGGEAIEKNKIIIDDDLDLANLAACRHANGRDWWIIQKRSGEAVYFVFLLNPSGVFLHHQQTIGFAGSKDEANGNSLFTRDGEKYIQANSEHHLLIMDFDRCAGTFSNQIHILNSNIKDSLSVYAAAAANSQFLYVCDLNNIWQYDLRSNNIAGSELLVASFDGYIYRGNWYANFYSMQLAPDDKIYISCFGGNSGFIHRITYPNKKGVECNVEQRAIKLPAEMAGTLPLSAYYKLGPIIGTICDSLYDTKSSFNIHIFPNPGKDYFTFDVQQANSFSYCFNLEIYNSEGKLFNESKFTNSSEYFSISSKNWAYGIYFYYIKINGIEINHGKLIKIQ